MAADRSRASGRSTGPAGATGRAVDGRPPSWVRAARPVVLTAVSAVAAASVVGGLRAAGVWLGIGPRAAAWRALAEGDGDLLYVALGDSTAQGLGSRSPRSSYVGLLADDLRRRSEPRTVRVVNLSVSGARVADVVAQQVPALRALLDAGARPDLVTLTVGANDAGRTDAATFRASLRTLLDAMPPGSYVADVPDFGGGPRLGAAHDLAAVVREEVAARPSLRQVHLEAATGRMRWTAYAGDLFHPSDAGYRLYAGAFLEAVRTSA